MDEKLEKLVKIIYAKTQSSDSQQLSGHPDEEGLACFIEGRLDEKESREFRAHLADCEICSQNLALALKLTALDEPVPEELISAAKGLVSPGAASLLKIVIKLKNNILELINTSGDVLVGSELVPAPILRSRNVKDFKDEVTILKDFPELRVEVKLENKGASFFNLIIAVKEKESAKIIKDLRMTLVKEGVEMESYLAQAGKAIFEHVEPGKYSVEIIDIDKKLASILLDVHSHTN